jgi:hypothetical protein
MQIKYIIKRKKEDSFVPYSVTFKIKTKEQHKWFHNQVACKITDQSCTFIGYTFEAGHDFMKNVYHGKVEVNDGIVSTE